MMHVREIFDGRKHKSCNHPRYKQPKDVEELPQREGMHRRYVMDWDARLDGNFKPVVRYLRSSVGKRWDTVYSELTARFDPRSRSGESARKAAKDFVLQPHEVVNIDGVLYHQHWGWKLGRWDDDLYVDSNGILRMVTAKARPKYKPEVPNNYTRIDGRHFAQFLNCNKQLVWFELLMKPIPAQPHGSVASWVVNTHDVLFGLIYTVSFNCRRNRSGLMRDLYGASIYAHDRRQLSKKDLRKYNLSNIIQNG